MDGRLTEAADVDRAQAALITDLKQRGLLDETLVVWGGEFGRTPMVETNPALGRSHRLGQPRRPGRRRSDAELRAGGLQHVGGAARIQLQFDVFGVSEAVRNAGPIRADDVGEVPVSAPGEG